MQLRVIYIKGNGYMNDSNLKKLNRRQLLEILLEQTKRIEELENELEKTQVKLNDRTVKINSVGSLAEASLILSDIFKAADEAISIQMQNIEKIAKEEEKRVKKELREFKKKEKEKIAKKNMSKVEENNSSNNLKNDNLELVIKEVSNNKQRRNSKLRKLELIKEKGILNNV